MLARFGLETNEGSLAVFFPPRRYHQLQLRIAAGVAAAANLLQQFVRVMDSLFPALPKVIPPGVDFAGRRLRTLIRLRRLL
jgi:hypothetical protein